MRLLQWGASPAAFCEHVNELGATEVASQEITVTLVALRVWKSRLLGADHVSACSLWQAWVYRTRRRNVDTTWLLFLSGKAARTLPPVATLCVCVWGGGLLSSSLPPHRSGYSSATFIFHSFVYSIYHSHMWK